MNDYVAKITLDLNCQATPIVISAGQYDIGRQIKISLFADGEAYDATGATAVCKGKSGSNYFAVNATVAKNIVTVTTDKAMLSSAGRTVAKIVLTDGTRTYSTQPFVINTHSDYDGDITTSDYYPELLNILSRVLALTESGAVLTDTKLSATSVNPLQNKVLTPIINTINNRLQSAEQNLYSKANATDVSNALKSKEDTSNKVSSKTDITDSSTNYPSIKYLNDYYYDANESYSSAETDELLGNKADSNSVYSKVETDDLLGDKADKADVDDVKAYIGYTDSDILGLQVDFENKTFKRLAGAVGLSAGSDFDKFTMYGGRKRCNVADDGTITAYYGDENYAEDGSNGQVMVYQPAFYYKVVPLKLEKNSDSGIGYHIRKANYYVSATPHAGFKLHPAFINGDGNEVDYILYSAYEGCMYDTSKGSYVYDNIDKSIDMDLTADLICSVADKKPISGQYKNLNKPYFEKLSANRGNGWHCETIKATSANQLLMMIEMGTMNLQSAIGRGVVDIRGNATDNCASNTGSTSSLGNKTGQAASTLNLIGNVSSNYSDNGKVAVSYRGIENPWGNLLKHIQGINIWGDGSMSGGQPYIADDFSFNESKNSDNYKPVGFTLPNTSGYINALGYGSEDYDWLMMPSETGGTSTLPIGDYISLQANMNSYRIVNSGGNWFDGINSGGFRWFCAYGEGGRGSAFGGRLMYVPSAKSGNTPTKPYSASEVDSLLATKYDSSNIESGTSKLTPYSSITDKIKSASCVYKTIGDVVIINVTITMNAISMGANTSYPLIDLPYKCIAVDDVFCVGISNLGKLFKFAIPKNNTWLQFSTQDKTAYTFADGEQINVICLYKIK